MGAIRILTLSLALVVVACGSTGTPSQSPWGTSRPTSVATASRVPTSSNTPPAAPATPNSSSPAPSATLGPGTPTPSGHFVPGGVSVETQPFVSGLTALTFITNAGDGSNLLYVVEQRGTIDVLSTDGTLQDTPFLDIVDRIQSGGERGLLGLAFHPDYESNGRFFVDYTDVNGDTVVSEFPVGEVRDGQPKADPGSERILLTVDQPFANHNGGMLAFGADGYLYIGMGDGGSGGEPLGNGQDMATLLGKMLRIDVDSGDPYAIPADNPFADSSKPEIWSSGWRNPWRYSFDRVTGGMFVGDVGQGSREEVDVEPSGAGGRNYGWNIMEGDLCFNAEGCTEEGLTFPVVAYGRDNYCAVTGGYVYRGPTYPELYGAYVFSDYCSGTFWAFDAEAALASGTATMTQLGDGNVRPTSFGEDEAGDLYVVDGSGSIYKLVATPR